MLEHMKLDYKTILASQQGLVKEELIEK